MAILSTQSKLHIRYGPLSWDQNAHRSSFLFKSENLQETTVRWLYRLLLTRNTQPKWSAKKKASAMPGRDHSDEFIKNLRKILANCPVSPIVSRWTVNLLSFSIVSLALGNKRHYFMVS